MNKLSYLSRSEDTLYGTHYTGLQFASYCHSMFSLKRSCQKHVDIFLDFHIFGVVYCFYAQGIDWTTLVLSKHNDNTLSPGSWKNCVKSPEKAENDCKHLSGLGYKHGNKWRLTAVSMHLEGEATNSELALCQVR